MQLSIKDSDLKGVFNLEVNDIVFPLCKDNIRMFTFSRKGPSFVLCLHSSLSNMSTSKATEVTVYLTYRTNAVSHRDLFMCYSCLSLSWTNFLNHFSTGAVLFLVQLSIAFIWHFQDAGISKTEFPADTHSSSLCWTASKPRMQESDSQTAKPGSVMPWTIRFFRSSQDHSHRQVFHHIRLWREERCNVLRRLSILLGEQRMAVLC